MHPYCQVHNNKTSNVKLMYNMFSSLNLIGTNFSQLSRHKDTRLCGYNNCIISELDLRHDLRYD